MYVKDYSYFSSSEKERKEERKWDREIFVSKVERKCLILLRKHPHRKSSHGNKKEHEKYIKYI